MSFRVVTTPETDSQVRTIDEWWRRNRSASPDLFLNELTHAFDTLGRAPHIGRPYRRSPVPGTRRVLLSATRYHVYYVFNDDSVIVLTVWHAERGGEPRLR